MLSHMQKIKFLPKFTFEIQFVLITLGMPDHTHLKWLNNFYG